jgi:hypothetical protein
VVLVLGNVKQIAQLLLIAAYRLERWLKNPEYKVVVCGGDGSVGWVLGVAFDMKLKKQPKVTVTSI